MVNLSLSSLASCVFNNSNDESSLYGFMGEGMINQVFDESTCMTFSSILPPKSPPMQSSTPVTRNSHETRVKTATRSSQTTVTVRVHHDVDTQTPRSWDQTPVLKNKIRSHEDRVSELKKQLGEYRDIQSNFVHLTTAYKELSERNNSLETQLKSLQMLLNEKDFHQPTNSTPITNLTYIPHTPVKLKNYFSVLDEDTATNAKSMEQRSNQPRLRLESDQSESDQLNATHTCQPNCEHGSIILPCCEPSLKLNESTSEPSNLIIGDSMLKHIKTRGLSNTYVKTLRGATVRHVHNTVREIDLTNVANVIVHVGTNDCSSTNYDINQLKTDFNELISHLKANIPGEVYVSGLCPRLDDPQINIRVLETNEMLKMTYSDYYIDNFKAFRCSYGVDPSKFTTHGLHLNRYGTLALIKSINDVLPILPFRRKITEHSTNTVTYRHFCGENGHNRRNCRHGQPVICWVCQLQGHKSKFCQGIQH